MQDPNLRGAPIMSDTAFHQYALTSKGRDEYPNYCHFCRAHVELSEAEARWPQPGFCDSCEQQGLADDQMELVRGNI